MPREKCSARITSGNAAATRARHWPTGAARVPLAVKDIRSKEYRQHTLLRFAAVLLSVVLLNAVAAMPTSACCAVHPSEKPVVNADQSVIILWDAATKTEHLVRKASFRGDADEVWVSGAFANSA